MLNDLYAKDISRKVKKVIELKKSNGKFVGSFAPYGYKVLDDGSFIIDKDTSNIVEKIFFMTLKGINKKEICNELNQNNVKTPSDNLRNNEIPSKWNNQIIDRILKNPTYIGRLTQNTRKKISYKDKTIVKIPLEEWLINDEHHDAIISETIFHKVQDILKINNSGSSDYLVGFLKCGDCGNTMTVKTAKNKTYYNCSSYIRKNECFSHSINKDLVLKKIALELKCTIEEINLEFLIDKIKNISIYTKDNIKIDLK